MAENKELDPKAAMFALSKAMKTLYGVAYSEIMTDVHNDDQFFLTAYDNGARTVSEITSLAHQIGYESGFVSVAEKGEDAARGYNLAKAGLLAHASTHDDWKRGNEGTLYRHYDNGVLALHPHKGPESDSWQYVAVQFEGAEMDRLMTHMVKEGKPVRHFFGRLGAINEEIVSLGLVSEVTTDADEPLKFGP